MADEKTKQSDKQSDKAERLRRIMERMNAGSGVDMLAQPEVTASERVYTGRIFAVDDQKIRLPQRDGGSTLIGRQIIRHPHAAIMLVHNTADDTYLVEREYRVGPNAFSFGVPAGLVDPHESALMAAFRELREETGIVVPSVPSGTQEEREAGRWNAEAVEKAATASPDVTVETLGSFYSSQGMSDELGTIFVLHLHHFALTDRHFDADEHVQSAWVGWDDMTGVIPFRGTSVNFALLHEKLRRLAPTE
jgi:8-oxo-dGTP pyrophosphatase MutT (NUDIX family)